MKSKLNKKQLNSLAMGLYLTGKDAMDMARALFGVEVGIEVYDDLEDIEEMFRCTWCNTWKGTDEMSLDDPGYCEECQVLVTDDDEDDDMEDDWDEEDFEEE